MKKSIVVLFHLGYWVMYVILLIMIMGMLNNLQVSRGEQMNIFNWIPFFVPFAIVPGVVSFYSFYSILFSQFLSRKKILLLLFSAILVSVISGLTGGIILSIMAYFGFGAGIFDNVSSAAPMLIIMSFNALANGIIGLVLKGFITSYADIRIKEDLNKKNFEMELALIKSQINPHFLFNTLNNIDVLIHKDATKASSYLNKLSDIMRFMLYETKTDKIPLLKELTYIEKYIELQKIRTTNLNYVNYSVKGSTDGLLIAPMLFIPFIENAFKHAENKKIENAIDINILIEDDKIEFNCENNFTEITQNNTEQNGLGNELIRKRLSLLYPEKHLFKIETINNSYKVNLILY
jgi:two-component system, LytTR family, sensor kinase